MNTFIVCKDTQRMNRKRYEIMDKIYDIPAGTLP